MNSQVKCGKCFIYVCKAQAWRAGIALDLLFVALLLGPLKRDHYLKSLGLPGLPLSLGLYLGIEMGSGNF